jgi:hypothetical protein
VAVEVNGEFERRCHYCLEGQLSAEPQTLVLKLIEPVFSALISRK